VTDHGRTTGTALRKIKFRLSPAALAIATAMLFAADWGSSLAGDSLLPGAPLDETAHFLTTLLILWAIGPRSCQRFLATALVASVAIDVDHVPARLGAQWLTAGTQRPYTHSLMTVAVVVLLALVGRRRSDLWLGAAIGLAIHLWRDMGEGSAGVSLLWPFSDRSFQYPHACYVGVMAVFVLIDAARSRGYSPGGHHPRSPALGARPGAQPRARVPGAPLIQDVSRKPNGSAPAMSLNTLHPRVPVKPRSPEADSKRMGGALRGVHLSRPWHEILQESPPASLPELGTIGPGHRGDGAAGRRRAGRVPIRRTAPD
jgi:hypothetical protein